MTESPLVSVVITNFNYGRYLADAIESVLGQTYPGVELIVVDDGSTDQSAQVIARFAPNVRTLFKANGGQASAINAGMHECRGDVVIFLDADDRLLPGAARTVAEAFRTDPTVARIQYRLETIDEAGRRTGSVVPPVHVGMLSGDLRFQAARQNNLACWPPMSGNAFGAWTLRRLPPLPEAAFRISADYPLVRANALLGRIVSLDTPLAQYREHDASRYRSRADRPEALQEYVALVEAAHRHLRQVAANLGLPDLPESPDALSDASYSAARLTLLRLGGTPRRAWTDPISTALRGAVASLRRTNTPARVRLLQASWFPLVLFAPRSLVSGLARLHFRRRPSPARDRILLGVARLPSADEPALVVPRPASPPRWPLAFPCGETPVSVVVVSYNAREHLSACLASVFRANPARVVVVDNASTDGSAKLISAQFPDAALLRNDTNLGYGAAANRGIAACSTPYVLLLNGDTVLAPAALSQLSLYLDQHPEAAVVGPRIVWPDGSLQPSAFPNPGIASTFLEESRVDRILRHLPVVRERSLYSWSHLVDRSVPWVLGAALALRASAFQAVGGFDESFFLYYEEVDLCSRLIAAGWAVRFAPVTTVVHAKGASTSQRRGEMLIQLHRSALLYQALHSPRWESFATAAVLKAFALARASWNGLRYRLARSPERRSEARVSAEAWRTAFRVPLPVARGRG